MSVTSLALLAIAVGLVVEVFSDSPLQHGDPPPDVPSGLVAILALGIPCLAVLAVTVGSAHSRKIDAILSKTSDHWKLNESQAPNPPPSSIWQLADGRVLGLATIVLGVLAACAFAVFVLSNLPVPAA